MAMVFFGSATHSQLSASAQGPYRRMQRQLSKPLCSKGPRDFPRIFALSTRLCSAHSQPRLRDQIGLTTVLHHVTRAPPNGAALSSHPESHRRILREVGIERPAF